MKYFFFDIDGTLAVGEPGAQYVPESTREALRLLEKKGHFVAIATGRAQIMAEDIMHSFGLKNMVSDGGNGITVDDKLIEITPLDRDKCIALIDECEDRGLAWGISPENTKIRLTSDEKFQRRTNDNYIQNVVVPGLDPRDYEKIYKVYVACDPPMEHSLSKLKGLPWVRYTKEYFYVEPIEKSRGIYRMLELIGGDPKEVVTFGDGLNDMDMFGREWLSIAVGNAAPELKAKADYVTADAANDGIYKACRHFGWI